MASPFHLVRSVSDRLAACSRVLLAKRVPGSLVHWNRIPAAFSPFRLQHSDSSSSSSSSTENATDSSATEAEKTPVVIDNDLIVKMLQDMENDMPISDMPNPYLKEHKRCILCKYNLDVDYKNVRLLSQFVSPYTGRIYGRAITGLCIPMQKRVAKAIKTSRVAGYMPFMLKKSEYLKDPRLFDPFKPAR